jgi:hypothetical protein
MNLAVEIATAVIAVWLAANGAAFLLLLWGVHKQRGEKQ